MGQLAYDPKNPVPCLWCGQPTPSRGTQLCDGCWELETRIRADPQTASKILAHVEGADHA